MKVFFLLGQQSEASGDRAKDQEKSRPFFPPKKKKVEKRPFLAWMICIITHLFLGGGSYFFARQQDLSGTLVLEAYPTWNEMGGEQKTHLQSCIHGQGGYPKTNSFSPNLKVFYSIFLKKILLPIKFFLL